MAFAPNTVKPIGGFVEKDYGKFFHFSENDTNHEFGSEYPHLIWVGPDYYEEPRYARVLKTVAYVVTDEDEFGYPVVEKWDIKNFKSYTRV
jgi:hypothetical protein